jgi:hypothetical protein
MSNMLKKSLQQGISELLDDRKMLKPAGGVL